MRYEWITNEDGTSSYVQVTDEVQETKIVTDEFICDVCGKVCSSRIALAGHKRSH